ncbi:S9 family peptidase [Mesohalobacter halotolerans]|uniref:Proline-specific endopeptidase n=1 Tax=Mesohalobacter halotolerans TaxID=1883405 RepID=A0A4V6AM38_9FLAO|nr:S9 family peptidase [Mesohalobacter halotolerans]TKS55855.1 S9 family peptidase [Mesohalobacter halotolerans]
MKNQILLYLCCIIFASSCKNTNELQTSTQVPKAPKKDTTLIKHGDKRIDPYYWLNERENPEVIQYLEAENAYYKTKASELKPLQDSLFSEIKSKIKEDDESVPYKFNGYWYITKYETGQDYPIYTRKKETLNAEEEVLFNVNQLAKGHSYYNLGGLNVSPNNQIAAYAIDTVGRRQYTIKFKNLKTREILSDEIKNVTGSSAWANDNKTVFYTRKHPQTLRSYQIYKHQLGTSPENDVLIYEETDETFNTYVYKSKSQQYIIIGSSSTTTDDYRILNADKPDGKFINFTPRQSGLEYNIAHFDDAFYILTNHDKATNFKLMKTPVDDTSLDHWTTEIPHRDNVLLENIDIFKKYLVTTERHNGLSKLHVMSWNEQTDYFIPFESETYTVGTSANLEFDTDKLRFTFTSLNVPPSVMRYDMTNKQLTILKQKTVQDPNFNQNDYETKRLWATADDGTKIPISIIYKKGLQRDGQNPLLQYGYGSYGATIDPYFSYSRLSLLDRGFVFALAHIRGGEYLGREWYEDGKLFNKKNTFTDFIAVSKHLIKENYTSPEHLYAMGGSAGGLLMGAVANMAPELYNGIVAQVPFVDVVTTMLDESIPLTTGEYDEWGNPNTKEYYEYIKSYSPYDNVQKQDYPNMFITTGLHDSQVQYWEPAKWVAKLRDLKTDNNVLWFHTNMEAGHSGASGRFESLKETARDYAFLLYLERITD